jgi:hypothetical protein
MEAQMSGSLAVALATPSADAAAGLAQASLPAPLAWYEAPLEERMALVRRGVPAHWLRTLAAAMDLSRSTLCELLGLKLSTINRKLQHHLLLRPDEGGLGAAGLRAGSREPPPGAAGAHL